MRFQILLSAAAGLCFLIVPTACCPVVGAADVVPPTFDITLRNSDDSARVTQDDSSVVLSLQSPRGIGNAKVRRRDPAWPQRMTVRLHLRGMEKLQLSNGTLTLHASVSSNGSIRSWQHGDEKERLDAKSPYWMNIKRAEHEHTDKTQPSKTITVPIFEFTVPPALIAESPEELTISWIDFYRN
ncbi:hypothetical protein [Rhodopirellula sallentina]|uniref:Putative secreted protein n=1 Tax=Rhodopirellula sallentina SM41 TaxID=1263870 RepID=M5U9P1_9BACT|nr:hypothetical protein [Rhodopirellula sallentina]EMI58029.1 putative secreted protein [Rhodopirellula sallentina SM41]